TRFDCDWSSDVCSSDLLWRRLRREQRRSRLLLQIHDELVLEVPPEELEEVVPLVRQEMTGALAHLLQVPLGVDLGVGPNWLEVEIGRASCRERGGGEAV